MTTDTDTAPAEPAIRLTLDPEEPEAGCSFTLTAEIDPEALPEATDLVILDASGEEIARADLVETEDDGLVSEPLTLTAPGAAGDCRWQAVLIVEDADADAVDSISQDFTLRVRAHPVGVVVWGIPSALSVGETVSFHVGLKCPCGCDTAGWPFRLVDAAGETIHEGRVGDTPWSGTEGLHFAELTLPAPDSEGTTTWTAASGEPDQPVSHAEGRAEFRLVTRPVPEVTVTVVVTEAGSGEPVPGAKVVIHPYRTLADENGIAHLRVPKGHYIIQVSGRQYFASRTEGDVDEDVTIDAVLEIDRPFTDADAWA